MGLLTSIQALDGITGVLGPPPPSTLTFVTSCLGEMWVSIPKSGFSCQGNSQVKQTTLVIFFDDKWQDTCKLAMGIVDLKKGIHKFSWPI